MAGHAIPPTPAGTARMVHRRRNAPRRWWIAAALLVMLACTPASPPAIQSLPDQATDQRLFEQMSIPALDEWVDKYRSYHRGEVRFFAIDQVMTDLELSRLQAVELQNHWRDQNRADPAGDPQLYFETAFTRVQAGMFESALDPTRLANASFIVVFDLDDTLWDQYYPTEIAKTCHDISYSDADGNVRYLKLAPGWEEAFASIREQGGTIALFSANVDDPTREHLRHWTWENQALLEHPDIAGVLTNSYLIQQEKRFGDPVVEPSKDLRIFDETLQRVIIVDDNPRRLFQFANTRVTRKFHADQWCAGEQQSEQAAAMSATLPQVSREISSAVTAGAAHEMGFAQAFLPFSVMGRLQVDALMHGNHWTEEQAVEWVRHHPQSVDERF